jgi:hypothetical protein
MLPRGTKLCQFGRTGLAFELEVVAERAVESGLEEGVRAIGFAGFEAA